MIDIKGKRYSQLTIGDVFTFAPVTVTSACIDAFARLTGDRNLLHMSEEFAQASRFSGRIAHGMLTASLALAPLGDETFNGTAVAMTVSSWKFLHAVKIGDSLATTARVREKKEGKGSGGKVTFAITAANQEGTPVLEGEAEVIIGE
jgi:3-hydroxybutyryl-CoA dehydratase